MGAVVTDVTSAGGVATVQEKPSILVWFDWAEKLTTGLGGKSQWNLHDENNFDAVLYSLVSALHYRPGDKMPENLLGAMETNPVQPPFRLTMPQSHQATLETIGLFLLERLATRIEEGGQEQAFDISEQLRATTSMRSIFAAQLQLFQMSLVDGNPELATRGHDDWGNRAELKAIASTPRTMNPTSFTADVYRRADVLMRNFFSREGARLDAA